MPVLGTAGTLVSHPEDLRLGGGGGRPWWEQEQAPHGFSESGFKAAPPLIHIAPGTWRTFTKGNEIQEANKAPSIQQEGGAFEMLAPDTGGGVLSKC